MHGCEQQSSRMQGLSRTDCLVSNPAAGLIDLGLLRRIVAYLGSVHDCEGGYAAKNQIFQGLCAGRPRVQKADLGLLQRGLPVSAPDTDLTVISLALCVWHGHQRLGCVAGLTCRLEQDVWGVPCCYVKARSNAI